MTQAKRGGIALSGMIFLCVVMHILSVLPHHHHNSSAAPCINPFHCTAEAAASPIHEGACSSDAACTDNQNSQIPYHNHDNGNGCADHRHDTGDPSCRFNHVDIIPDTRDQAQISIAADAPLLFDCIAIFESLASIPLDESRSDILNSLGRDIPPLHTFYISAALQPRAPSLTA